MRKLAGQIADEVLFKMAQQAAGGPGLLSRLGDKWRGLGTGTKGAIVGGAAAAGGYGLYRLLRKKQEEQAQPQGPDAQRAGIGAALTSLA